MRAPISTPLGFVLPLSVTVSLVWGGLAAVWYQWTMATFRYPAPDAEGPFRLLATPTYVGVTLVDLALVLWITVDWRARLRGDAPVRRAHAVGLVLALIAVLACQLAFHHAHGPIPVDR